MPRCPSCAAKVKKDDAVCPACGAVLNKETGTGDKEAFLISVNRDFESKIVEGCLRSAGIPFMIKTHGGPEGFVRYDTDYESLGADFYVPSKLLEKAKQALPPDLAIQAGASGESVENTDEDVPHPISEEVQKPEDPKKTFIAVILFLILAALVVAGVDTVMNLIRAALGYD